MAELLAKNTDNFLKAPKIKLEAGTKINYQGIHQGGISLEVSGILLDDEFLGPIVLEWEKHMSEFDDFMWNYLKNVKGG